MFCFVFGLITHVPRRLESSEEAVLDSWVNSCCSDLSMKDFLICLPKSSHGGGKVKKFSGKLGAKTFLMGNSE